jgi:tetratricopeptide (TPR) repeat protein
MAGGLRLELQKVASSSAASWATRRLGCQQGRCDRISLLPCLNGTKSCLQIPNPGNADLQKKGTSGGEEISFDAFLEKLQMTIPYRIYCYLRCLTRARMRLWDRFKYWIARGNAARDARGWSAAARCYRKALKLQPDLAPIWVQYGHALKESGQPSDAEAAYRRALALAPNNADTHLQLGHLKKLQGEISSAAESYAEALRRDNGLIDAASELRALGCDADVQKILDEKTHPCSVADQIASHFWWHSIDLGNGIVTPGKKRPARMAAEFANTFARISLVGKSVLDIGAWNGGFSVEAARRGAARVVALDHYTWNLADFRGRETFELVNSITGLGLEAVDVDLDAPQLSLGGLGQFDVVLFFGRVLSFAGPDRRAARGVRPGARGARAGDAC